MVTGVNSVEQGIFRESFHLLDKLGFSALVFPGDKVFFINLFWQVLHAAFYQCPLSMIRSLDLNAQCIYHSFCLEDFFWVCEDSCSPKNLLQHYFLADSTDTVIIMQRSHPWLMCSVHGSPSEILQTWGPVLVPPSCMAKMPVSIAFAMHTIHSLYTSV